MCTKKKNISSCSCLICILRGMLTFKNNPADLRTKRSQNSGTRVHQKTGWHVKPKPITGERIFWFNKTQTKCNGFLFPSTVTFSLLFFSIFYNYHLACLHFSFLPAAACPPSLSFHSKSTFLPPSFSLFPSKTTAVPGRGPSIFFSETWVRGSAKATADYYLPLPPLNTG